MNACLCTVVHQLAESFDEAQAKAIWPALNQHLRDVRAVLAQSRSLAQEAHYAVTPNNARTAKVLAVESIDLAPIARLRDRLAQDPNAFWGEASADDAVHNALQRRLACVVLFLRSRIDAEAPVPPRIKALFPGQQNYLELRTCGRKYLKMSRRLSQLGSVLWLPLEVPHSTYERYLNIDDDEVFDHLRGLGPGLDEFGEFVRQLTHHQLTESFAPGSQYNLITDYPEIISPSDQLMVILHALGGRDVPDAILRSLGSSQRRWNTDGEIESLTPEEFGLHPDLILTLSTEQTYSDASFSPYVTRHTLHSGIDAWSIHPDVTALLNEVLQPRIWEEMGITAVKLLSFACPPCYEGNVTWGPAIKNAVWPVFDRTLDTVKWNPTLRTQALEAVLYFAERDSVATRQAAATRAKSLVRKSMPYYLHASVPLLQSILHRVAGNLPKSEAVLRDFKRRGPSPSTRRDHALLGRLHIAQVETKIRCFDSDVNTFMYEWEPEQPLSTLDIEVKSRLQSTAARYFQSIGNFEAARASLEQHLSMSKSKPMRPLSRCVMVARLGDVYCELGQYERAEALLGAELAALDDGIRQRRPFRYLSLAWIEANIGLRKYRVAEDAADRLEDKMPRVPEDLHDQQQHMRRLIAKARVSHLVDDYEEAIARWKLCLDRMKQMETLQTTSGFIAATIYISSSHAHLASGDRDGGRRAWGTAVSILKEDTCNFWAPVVATSWLQDMVVQINKMQGWSLRIKMPGGQPDFACP